MTNKAFKAGDAVALKNCPTRKVQIAFVRDGQFVLADDCGNIVGGAFANDLVAA